MRPFFALSLGFAALGCCPYRQLLRPSTAGVVVDVQGHAIGGATVTACTWDAWIGLGARGCELETRAISGAEGTFGFEEAKHWAFLTIGEAPRPQTLVVACGPDGQRGLARLGETELVRITLASTARAPQAWQKEQLAYVEHVCGPTPPAKFFPRPGPTKPSP